MARGAAEEVRFGDPLVVGRDLGAAHRADERGVAREEARARGLAERVDRLEAADGVAEVRVDGPMAVEKEMAVSRGSEEGRKDLSLPPLGHSSRIITASIVRSGPYADHCEKVVLIPSHESSLHFGSSMIGTRFTTTHFRRTKNCHW